MLPAIAVLVPADLDSKMMVKVAWKWVEWKEWMLVQGLDMVMIQVKAWKTISLEVEWMTCLEEERQPSSTRISLRR